MVFSQAKCLSVHLKKMHPEMEDCNNVERYGLSLEGSVLRLKRVWKNQPRRRLNYRCLVCSSIISCRRGYGEHVRVDLENRKVSCVSKCPKGAALNTYQKHIFLTGGRRRLLCHTCGASFTERSTFLNHIDSHGEIKGKLFTCTLCSYSASAERFLRLHYEKRHPQEPRVRSHVCEQCGKAFYEKIVLEEHVEYVHRKVKKFQCDKCPKVFYRPQSFLRHKKTHTGKRPWVCTVCGASFMVPYNLKVHMRLHTGERPFLCKHCDATFRQKNSLDLHLKKHTKKDGLPLAPGGDHTVVARATRSEQTSAVFANSDVVTAPCLPAGPDGEGKVVVMAASGEQKATVFADGSVIAAPSLPAVSPWPYFSGI